MHSPLVLASSISLAGFSDLPEDPPPVFSMRVLGPLATIASSGFCLFTAFPAYVPVTLTLKYLSFLHHVSPHCGHIGTLLALDHLTYPVFHIPYTSKDLHTTCVRVRGSSYPKYLAEEQSLWRDMTSGNRLHCNESICLSFWIPDPNPQDLAARRWQGEPFCQRLQKILKLEVNQNMRS